MMSSPLLVNSLVERAGRLFPGVEVLSVRPDGTRDRYTMADLRRRSRQLSAALQQAGIVGGDRVATLLWNQQEHLEAYFGIPAIGAVLHPLNMRLHPDDLAYVVRHAGDRLLIVDEVLLDVFAQLASRVQFERVVVVDRGGAILPPGAERYESFLHGALGEPRYPAIDEQDAAAMCFTSGTTGQPKGVLYSHRSISLHSLALSLPDQLGFICHDTVLLIASMFHVNSWGFPYAAVMNGSRLVMPGRNLRCEALLDLMQQEQVTVTGAVPSVLLAMLHAMEQNPGRWKLAPGLRILNGGSAAPESMFRRFDTLGVRLIHAWGMTETGPAGTVCNLKASMRGCPEADGYARRATQGIALPFIDVRAVGEDGETAWDGEATGELQVRGPWVASSYYGLDQPDKWTDDGWFRTGDVASIDSEGYVKITDRLKDLIKSGGEWISSVDLENALVAHAAVREAAVVAVPHPKWLERPLAVVILKDGATADAAALRVFLEQRFARWQVPDAFVFVRELPYTSTGKLLKSKLRQDFKDWSWELQ